MKTFVSIGSGPGMGLATAERFAREGFRVVLSARNTAKTEDLAQQLRAKGHTVEVETVDTAKADSVIGLIDKVIARHGTVDVVHYNAASMRQATLADQPADTFNSDLAVNIGGALAAAKRASEVMSARGAGTLLFTGGGFALQPSPDYLSLSIGKAGIRALALGLFDTLKDKGIHVATVTVATFVDAGSDNATAVAERLWQLHSQPKDSWTVEETYSG